MRVYLTAGGAIALLALVVAPNPRLAAVPWALSGLLAAGAVEIGLRRRRGRRSRTFWRAIGAAVGSWGVTAAVFVAGLPASSSSYHLTDLLYVPGYLAIAAAAVVLIRRMGSFHVAGLEAIAGALTLTGFLWSIVVEPNLTRAHGITGIAAIVFPLCDVLLLMLLLRLMFSPAARLPAARLLFAAAVALVASDVAYFSPVLANGVLAGRLIAAGYVTAYVLFGAAALHPSMRRMPSGHDFGDATSPRRLLALLAWAPLSLPLALLLNRAQVVPLAVLTAAVEAIVFIRIGGLVRHLNGVRERAEASEQRFRMVFESAGHGITIGADGMMSETNPALQEMLGYTGKELSELHFEVVTFPEDRTLAQDATEDVMSGRLPSHTFEKRFLRKDGSSFWTEVTLTRARDGTFGIALVDDITERKQLEDELRHAQKMEAVGKLAGGIAHDFNNVMLAVSSCAENLLEEIAADDPRRERAEIIAQSAERATELTRQLLAFSRRQVLRLEPIDVRDVVRGLEPMLRRLLPPNILVTSRLDAGAVARADRPQLEQVLLNLALNARDAMPRGGHLHVVVERDGDAVELRISDDGHGMDEETKSRIFEPFFTTKPTGTGLGLSTVDGIVGQSGGTIAVESAYGYGTTFTIRLPLVAEAAAEPLPAPARRCSEATGAGRILLADDEDLVRRVTAEMLRRSGYDVVTAASGEEALELIGSGDPFDALVTDVAMTGMDGPTLARRARLIEPSLPVLFVSGYPAELLAQHESGIVAGDEVLTKPFTPDELAERIELVRNRMAPGGIEPPHAASKAAALSAELRGRAGVA